MKDTQGKANYGFSKDALDENEARDFLRNPRHRGALREGESDIKSGRKRALCGFLKDLSKRC